MSLNDLHKSFEILSNPALSLDFQDIQITRLDLELALDNAPNDKAYLGFLNECQMTLGKQNAIRLLDVIFDSHYVSYERLTEFFSLKFKHQDSAIGIATLGAVFVAYPKAFAAFLCYLIQQGMTPKEIGSTHLLHDYFCYHVPWLNRADCSIKTLYVLLGSLSDTLPLCKIAERTSCDYRGFEHYSLNGNRKAPDFAFAAQIPRIDFPPRFSPAKNNLQSLYEIFENEFLMGALYQWMPQRDNNEWVSNITQLFNQPNVIATHLPPVINQLHEFPGLAEPLAQILTHQSLVVLMKNHVVGLLHLTPFCPPLINMIQASDLLAYIQTLQQQNTSGPALFSSLFSFFKAVKDRDGCSASILFDAMLDAIHIDDCVLDDTIMLGKLRKFEHIKTRVSKKIDMLEKQLEQTMQLSITSNGIDYITISDVWRDASIKARHFKILDEKTETSIPMNEYLLRVNIARAFIELNGSARFDVEHFSREMKIEPKFDLITITPYERLLVELLSRLDNEDIRINCIELLNINARYSLRNWHELSYGNESFFRKAAISGNVGFIRWLYANQITCELSSDALAKIAVNNNQWAVVSYYYTEHALTSATVNMLFETATNQGLSSNIPAFLGKKYLMPDWTIIIKQFQVSIENNYLDNIPCFFACPTFNAAIKNPSKSLINKLALAFNHAVKQQYFEMVKLIAEGSVGKILQSTINQTLKDAARLGECEVLKTIRQLQYNGPGQKVVESSLFRAVRANQLSAVKELVVFSANSPRLQVIYEASQEAKKKELPDIQCYLSSLHKKNNKRIKKNDRKSTDSLNQLHSNSPQTALVHAFSCSSMSSLLRNSYFSLGRSASVSPIPGNKQELNKESTLSRTLSYKDALMR